MSDANHWSPRASSIRWSSKQYWCSHSLYGAFVGIFLAEAEALAASAAYDLEIELEIKTRQEESTQLIEATIQISEQEPLKRYLAYDSESEKHAEYAAESLEVAYSDLASKLRGNSP